MGKTGVTNAWIMPIGIKVFGKDLGEMKKPAKEIEAAVKAVPGTTSIRDHDIGGYVADAKKVVADRSSSRPVTTLPGAASSSTWSEPSRK